MSSEKATIQRRIDRWERTAQRRENEFNTARYRLGEARRWLDRAYDDMHDYLERTGQ